MKVYVVEGGYTEYVDSVCTKAGNWVLGIFSSEKSAIDYMVQYASNELDNNKSITRKKFFINRPIHSDIRRNMLHCYAALSSILPEGHWIRYREYELQ